MRPALRLLEPRRPVVTRRLVLKAAVRISRREAISPIEATANAGNVRAAAGAGAAGVGVGTVVKVKPTAKAQQRPTRTENFRAASLSAENRAAPNPC